MRPIHFISKIKILVNSKTQREDYIHFILEQGHEILKENKYTVEGHYYTVDENGIYNQEGEGFSKELSSEQMNTLAQYAQIPENVLESDRREILLRTGALYILSQYKDYGLDGSD
jgi:hypothetical protein